MSFRLTAYTRLCHSGARADILRGMARRRNNDISPEEFRELMREINKRMIIAGLIVIGVGLAIIGLMTLAYGG